MVSPSLRINPSPLKDSDSRYFTHPQSDVFHGHWLSGQVPSADGMAPWVPRALEVRAGVSRFLGRASAEAQGPSLGRWPPGQARAYGETPALGVGRRHQPLGLAQSEGAGSQKSN